MLAIGEIEDAVETSVDHCLLRRPDQVREPSCGSRGEDSESLVAIFLLVVPVGVILQVSLHLLLELVVVLSP